MKVLFLLISLVLLSIAWFGLPNPAWAQAASQAVSTPAPTAAVIATPTAPVTYIVPTPLEPAPAVQTAVVAPAALQGMMPDLQPLPPFDLQLLANPSARKRLLRFSNSFANIGNAALDLTGEFDRATLTVNLIQRVRGENGAPLTQRLGGFEYHPEHGHWHWQGFSIYEIWSLGLNAGLEQVVVLSGKIGYCMMDTERANTTLLESLGRLGEIPVTGQIYTSCGWRRQGISPGWVDTYQRHLPGQTLDVSALPDGVYALRSIVDPEGLLLEADKSNNAALTYFSLEGARLRVIKDERLVRSQIFRSLYGDQALFDIAGVKPGIE